jgi:hypothetical protein
MKMHGPGNIKNKVTRYFSPLHTVLTGSGIPLASYLVGTGGSSIKGKTAAA